MTGIHLNLFKKEKLIKHLNTLFSLKKWQLLLGTVLAAEFFTFLMNSIQSYIWWNFWSGDLILIGTIDALLIAGILAPLVIALTSQMAKYSEYKRKAEAEAKAQAELSVEEKKFRLYVENSVDAVTVVDRNGFIIYESPSVKRNFGYEPGDLVGRSAFEFIHPDDIKNALDLFTRAIKKPYSSNTIELRFLRKSGEWAHIHISGKNMISDPVISGVILNVSDITERVEMENRLKETISEKDTLMKEIHHRVKNNFMTISSLLYLQSELVNDPKVTQVFLECQNRIKSMALIHEKLYQSENLAEIDIQSYLQRLISFIHSSYLNSIKTVTINIEIESGIRLGTEKAISLGLIMNELLSNIFKYAFPSVESGKVVIRFFKKESRYHLFVKDNGIGFPEGYNFSTANSLGLKLVNMMSEQMKGKFAIINNGGTEFKIEFPA